MEAEAKLSRLLAEASASCDNVERLVNSRRSFIHSGALAAAPTTPSTSQQPSARLTSTAAPVFQSANAPLSPVIPAAGSGLSAVLAPPEGMLAAQLEDIKRKVDDLAVQQSAALPPRAAHLASHQGLRARISRRTDQNQRDLEHSHATIRELEADNAALRKALNGQRAALAKLHTMSAELEATRRKLAEEERARARDRLALDDAKFQLREAEAERERLRTLLAGTVWFQAGA
jgi:hypothetical protein